MNKVKDLFMLLEIEFMKILWFTWKDKKNPQAGGAELINEEIAKRLVRDGNEVIFVVAGSKDLLNEEMVNGYKIIRVGNRWTVYLMAFLLYIKSYRGWADLIIDEINTIPFFCKFYVKEKYILFVHQLCREIWFYQMAFPLSLVGYLLEPLYLFLLRKSEVITVSNSTKNDLIRFGFKEEKINIISEGIEIEAVKDIKMVKKYRNPTMLYLGAVRPMKRTIHILKAFEQAKKSIPDLRFIIAGDTSSKYGKMFLNKISKSIFRESIDYLGKVSYKKKIEIMKKSHLICVASVKEGWGLIVTEANSQGTPAIVYDVDGLRDSVIDGKTGLICKKNTSDGIASEIVSLIKDKKKYLQLSICANNESKNVTFEKSYSDFRKIIFNKLSL